MSQPISIRAARIPADSAEIARVYMTSARHHERLAPEWYRVPALSDVVEQFNHPLAEDSETIMVAEVDGVIAGFVHAHILPVANPASMIRPAKSVALDVAVTDEYRSMGIGTALLQAGERWAASQEAERLQLDALAANSRALRLYREDFDYADFGVLLHKRIR